MNPDYPNEVERYRLFRDGIFQAGRVGEKETSEPAFSELEIQARWFGGEFGRRFETPDGEPVEIVQFGHWNHSAGPDFTEAAVKIGGEVRTGAIEIDLEAANWESHGHSANPDFESVVLHVFLHSPESGQRFFTRTVNHKSVPQVQIDPQFLSRFGPAPLQLPEAKTGRCATPLAGMEDSRLVALLTAAARFRLQEKAQRIQMIVEAHSRDQALFQGLAEALGFRHNQISMAVLTQRLPIARLRNRPAIEREALLFGAAGFIGHDQFDEAADPNARTYLKGLWDHWWKLRAEFEPDPDRSVDWRIAGTRPANHPQRRLGALAALLEKWPTFSRVMKNLAKPDWSKEVRQLFGSLHHEFWEMHYTLRSRPSAKPLVLIGTDRIRDVLGNLLFPFAVSEVPGENWVRYCELPGSDSNESLRRACLRLFGPDSDRAKKFTKRYFQQQALLQVYRDFCLEDASGCEDCPFPEQLAQW